MIKAMSLFTVLETLPLVGVVGATLLLVYLYNFFRVYYVIYHRDQLISAKVAENTLSKYAILKNKFVTKESHEHCLDELEKLIYDKSVGLTCLFPDGDQKIARESAVMGGGGPAVLLQLSHPYVAFAIDKHSYSSSNPLLRFNNTFKYVFGITFGDFDSICKASRRVFATHSKINGVIPTTSGCFEKGHNYHATNKEVLKLYTPPASRWVWATLIDYSAFMYEIFVDFLSEEEKERHYQAARKAALVWGLEDCDLPKTTQEFMEYCLAMVHSDFLSVCAPAKTLADFLLMPLPLEGAIGMNSNALFSRVLLPAPITRQFGYERSWWDTIQFCSVVGVARIVYQCTPLSVRCLTQYQKMKARSAGKAGIPWISQVAECIGNWIVNQTLSNGAKQHKKMAS